MGYQCQNKVEVLLFNNLMEKEFCMVGSIRYAQPYKIFSTVALPLRVNDFCCCVFDKLFTSRNKLCLFYPLPSNIAKSSWFEICVAPYLSNLSLGRSSFGTSLIIIVGMFINGPPFNKRNKISLSLIYN